MTLERPLDPDTCGTRLPFLRSLRLLSYGGVQPPGADIDDDFVFCLQLLFAFALDVHICLGHPAAAEIEVLLNTVPFLLVEHTFGERVEGRTGLHGDVGDYEALVMERQVVVDSLGEDAVAAIEEEDKQRGNSDEGDELNARPDLHVSGAGAGTLVGGSTYYAARHAGGEGLGTCEGWRMKALRRLQGRYGLTAGACMHARVAVEGEQRCCGAEGWTRLHCGTWLYRLPISWLPQPWILA